MDGVFDKSWRCVTPVKGRYTLAYFDWVADVSSPTGGYLYVTNDWIVNDNGVVPDTCYNLFTTRTGGGTENWVIKVYGDQTVWVEKNGVVQEDALSAGAVGFGPSPNAAFNHTIFELKFPASQGIFYMELNCMLPFREGAISKHLSCADRLSADIVEHSIEVGLP